MNKKYILFDLDGTLTDPREGITKSVQYALSKIGIEEEREKLLRFIGPPLMDSFSQFYGLSEEMCSTAVRYYRERYSVKGLFENRAFDDALYTLSEMKKRGKVLALATSKPQDYAVRICEHFGFDKYLDYMCGPDMGVVHYSKADIIKKALDKMQVPDECMDEVIMVGDRKHDILGARQFGIETAGVRCGFAPEGEFEEYGAEYIVDTLSDLLKLSVMQ